MDLGPVLRNQQLAQGISSHDSTQVQGLYATDHIVY